MLLGQVVYTTAQWLIVAQITKFGGPVMTGQFGLATALTAPVFTFASLQLRAFQATDAQNEYSFSSYFSTRLVTSSIGFLIVLILAYIWDRRFGEIFWCIVVVGFAKGVESISDLTWGLFQKRERFFTIALSMTIKGVLTLLLFSIALYASKSLIFALVAGMVSSWMFTLLSIDLAEAKKMEAGSILSQSADVVELVRRGIPLGAVAGLNSLNANIPRYVLDDVRGHYDVGIYTAISYVTIVLGLIMSSVSQSVIPRLARLHLQAQREGFCKVLVAMLSFGIVVHLSAVFGSWVFGAEVLGILYSREFGEYADLLTLVMLFTTFQTTSAFLMGTMTAMRKINAQFAICCVSTLLTLSVSLWLIPKYGLESVPGAASVAPFWQSLWAGTFLWWTWRRKEPKS